MTDKDYYQILGVPRNATTPEIKKAYREKALKYHPDRNQGDAEAEEKFKAASEAYSVLGNEEKRQIFDQYGAAGLKTGGRDFSIFSDSIFADFGDILGDFFGFSSPFSGRDQGHRQQRGRDMGIEVQLTLEESYNGVERSISIEKEVNCATCQGDGSEPGKPPETCRQCGGSGGIRRSQGFFSISTTCPLCKGMGKMVTHPCKTCGGSGRTSAEKEIKVTFPAGVDQGNKLRISGDGEGGYNGGRPGDLYLMINVSEHEFFHRDENDLVCDLEISFTQAVLGDEVKLKTFYGTEKIKIPPVTENGRMIRIKGKGFKNVNGWGKGDFRIVFRVTTPQTLSRKEKELYTQLREIEQSKNKKKSEKDKTGLFV